MVALATFRFFGFVTVQFSKTFARQTLLRSARFAIVSFVLPFVNTFFGTFFPAHCVSQPLLVSLSESFISLPFFWGVVKKKRIKKPAALSWIVLTGLLPKPSFCRQFTFVIIIYLFLI